MLGFVPFYLVDSSYSFGLFPLILNIENKQLAGSVFSLHDGVSIFSQKCREWNETGDKTGLTTCVFSSRAEGRAMIAQRLYRENSEMSFNSCQRLAKIPLYTGIPNI